MQAQMGRKLEVWKGRTPELYQTEYLTEQGCGKLYWWSTEWWGERVNREGLRVEVKEAARKEDCDRRSG